MTRADDPRYSTTDGKPPRPGYEDAPAPAPVRDDGQHEAYWILSEAERAKGYVRPLRRSYRHVGERPEHPLRDLTQEEQDLYRECGYIAFEVYPSSSSDVSEGRFWTSAQLNGGCGATTVMGSALCETYARDPKFYGSTFCCNCGKHFPVAEFVWIEDGERVGS